MDKETLIAMAMEYLANSEKNIICGEYALRKDLVGMRIYDAPIFSVGSTDDPLFQELLKPEVIGPHVMLPQEWLPGAKSVVTFFMPFTQEVKDGNKRDMTYPASEWLHARIEGDIMLKDLCTYLLDLLITKGYDSIAPSSDGRFKQYPPASSNWSERHAAYICGLGTFGMSKGMITKKGVAGRFGSIITLLELPVDKRPYKGIYDYCIRCGACARNCPANAIDNTKGLNDAKNHLTCNKYLMSIFKKAKAGLDIRPEADQKLDYMPKATRIRYGCGKCQVGVPCENGIPNKKFQ